MTTEFVQGAVKSRRTAFTSAVGAGSAEGIYQSEAQGCTENYQKDHANLLQIPLHIKLDCIPV